MAKPAGSATRGADTGSESGRVMPHSREAEEAVLAGVLIDNRVLSIVGEQVRGPEDFYVEAHQKIFDAMLALSRASQPIDMITLPDKLREAGVLDAMGGHAYLAALIDAVPTTANIEHHARLVREKASVRRCIYAAKEIAARGMGDHGEVEDFLDWAEKSVFEVAQSRLATPYVHVRDVVHEVFRSVEAAAQRDSKVTGVPTGFLDLDDMTAGLQPADLIVVAGRPSMGKTAFCLNLACSAALQEGKTVLVFSLEMSRNQLTQRMLCSEGRIDASRMRIGRLRDDEWPQLIQAAGYLSESPIFIDDTPALSVMELRSKARRLKSEKGLDLVVVDYMQLMRGGPGGAESREREISEISRSLKALAKELQVPVVALSQLNRALESRQDKRPLLSDLRESGAIEQDADLILFIYRDEVYHEETDAKGVAEVIIGKQRNGPTGTVELRFTREHTRFDNLSRHRDQPAA